MNETYDHELETLLASSTPSFDDKLKIRAKYFQILGLMKSSSSPNILSQEDGHQEAINHLHNLDSVKNRIETYASLHKIDLYP